MITTAERPAESPDGNFALVRRDEHALNPPPRRIFFGVISSTVSIRLPRPLPRPKK
jgi:hypothetical protein